MPVLTEAVSEPLPSWQQQLAGAVRNVEELFQHLGLAPSGQESAATDQFPLLVPRSYLRRIRPGDREDPLLLQVLPQQAETVVPAGFVADPLGESSRSAGDGLIQKYRGRLLVIASGACPVHCRYCFRRHYDYAANAASREGFRRTLRAIASSSDSDEVILSGGDPLSLDNGKLERLLRALDDLPRIKRLRIHTRFPVVIPDRVDDELIALLRSLSKPIVVVLHINHANEIDAALAEAVARIKPSVATVLNQSVLLRNVNDDAGTLANLSETLFHAGVMPYYLHQLDAVAGAAHFAIQDDTARRLHRELAAQLPGYLVPKLVREVPGEAAKTLL